jgi:hypothetical protein
MKLNNYRIVEHAYRNKHGSITHSHYTVQEQKKLFRIKYWATIRHTEGGWGDPYRTETKFDSIKSARDFIDNVLRNGIKYDSWNTKIIEI